MTPGFGFGTDDTDDVPPHDDDGRVTRSDGRVTRSEKDEAVEVEDEKRPGRGGFGDPPPEKP